jgi:hypothetical protein
MAQKTMCPIIRVLVAAGMCSPNRCLARLGGYIDAQTASILQGPHRKQLFVSIISCHGTCSLNRCIVTLLGYIYRQEFIMYAIEPRSGAIIYVKAGCKAFRLTGRGRLQGCEASMLPQMVVGFTSIKRRPPFTSSKSLGTHIC